MGAREDRAAVERERRMAIYEIKELAAIAVNGELLTCYRLWEG